MFYNSLRKRPSERAIFIEIIIDSVIDSLIESPIEIPIEFSIEDFHQCLDTVGLTPIVFFIDILIEKLIEFLIVHFIEKLIKIFR